MGPRKHHSDTLGPEGTMDTRAVVPVSGVTYVRYGMSTCEVLCEESVYSAIQNSVVQCSSTQRSTVQYSTVQYSAVQSSTVQYSTA
jgi:hypothetical protein